MVMIMSEDILEKLNDIEALLLEINAKIDNFLGFEDLDEGERREIKKIRKSVSSGEIVSSNEVFED